MANRSGAGLCPCGLPAPYQECCGALHAGQPAPTAVLLMRSRYAAFVLGDTGYLQRSWHPDTRPARIRLDPAQVWLGLSILGTTAGGLLDRTGTVEFRADYRVGGRPDAVHENSRFGRHSGQWVYLGPTAS